MSQRQVRRYRILGKVMFVLYIAFLVYFLCFAEWYGRTEPSEGYRYNLVLFKEIMRFIEYREELGVFAVFANLFGNILIFVPYGFFISMASTSRGFFQTLFYSFALSLGVEIFQLFARVGSFDVDDLLLNTLGGVLGYILFLICNIIRRKCYGQKRKLYKKADS
ncbi:VanZ family protein [Schaedlerella sp.]|uniref:VanZ family protein n=1 Tax=Schaedlerella sp. TaxID=2676057 RepID=UPI00136210A7|nr:VanZ family protein [uncultured Schaedlerella sp.]MCI8767948.1 VanZ family protein [Ruminococcus sp.]NBI98690.1 VanZ family protein [Lachnospiraceae bacterium]